MQDMRKMPFPFVTPVRGVSFHQDVVCGAEVGTPLEVVADPENEFDANACAVRLDGELLGHLPRELAGRLRSSGDLCWSAEVVEVLRGSKATGLRIRLLAPSTPAVNVPGNTVRDGDGPAVSVVAGTEESIETPTTCEVFARSGRRLGELVDEDSGSVRVRTEDDRIVTYPQALVRLRQRTPSSAP